MRVQVLGSGSAGNALLVRAGGLHLLVDAGLSLDVLEARLDAARVAPLRIDAIALTHGHLDHARAAGSLSAKTGARVYCSERLMKNASVRRARTLATLPIGRPVRIAARQGADVLTLTALRVPHDAEPTVAFRLEHAGRVAAVITDLGRPDAAVARALRGAHLCMLEFNHDARLLTDGPYEPALKRRVGGPLGHLSNDQAAEMLALVADERMHTLVLSHLSAVNNRPELALASAGAALAKRGLDAVRLVVAEQDRVGPALPV